MKTSIALAVGLLFLAVSHPLCGQAAAATPDATASSPTANIDPAKVAEIRHLLELSGTKKLMAQMKTQMFAMFERQNPNVTPHVWEKLQNEMDDGQLLEQLIPVYDKYYSLEDLKILNAFYQTPTGQRMIAAMPLVMHDSMQIGQEWGRAAAVKIGREVQQERGTAGVPPGAH